MTRSFVRLLRVDAGFRPDHLVAANFTIDADRWTDSAGYRGFYRRVIDRARTLPGVTAAGAAQLLGAFGAMGLVLGALGIYGVLAYLVSAFALRVSHATHPNEENRSGNPA